jgi:hypothetical protein
MALGQETIDLGSFSMIGCGARKRSQDIDSTASFNVSAGAILLAFGMPRVVLVAIFVAFGGWLFLVLDTLPTQLNRIHQQLHRKQLSPLASSNDNMNDLNDPSAVQMQRAVEAVAAEAADSLRVQVADRQPVAVGVAAAEPVKEDVLDQMHIDALVAAEPINVNEDDPASVAACLRQVQSQLQQQIQVILAMKDKINELTVQRDTIQRELDSIKSSSKAPRTSTARGTPLPRNAAAMAHPLSHLGVTQDSTDVEIDAIFHAKKGGQLGGSQWPVHRLKKWIEDEDLHRVRLHHSEKHTHQAVRIPRTEKNKEGRLICKLCSGGKVNRNTTWMCVTCEVPLCVDALDSDSTLNHHVRWHQCVDLREEHLKCNQMLRERRESKKRSRLDDGTQGQVQQQQQQGVVVVEDGVKAEEHQQQQVVGLGLPPRNV